MSNVLSAGDVSSAAAWAMSELGVIQPDSFWYLRPGMTMHQYGRQSDIWADMSSVLMNGAIEHFKKAKEVDPSNWMIARRMSEVHESGKQWGLAIETLMPVVERFKNDDALREQHSTDFYDMLTNLGI